MGNFFSWFSSSDTENVEDDFPLILDQATIHFNRALGVHPNALVTQIRLTSYADKTNLGLEFDEKLTPTSSTRKYSKIEYKKIGNGCLVEWFQDGDFKEKLLGNQNFVDVFWENLEVILRTQKTKIEVFEIEFSEDGPDETIGKKILKTLDYRNTQLPVEEFKFKGPKTEQFLKILNFLDSNSLKSISIMDPKDRYEKISFMEELVRIDRWKNAEKIQIHGFDIGIQMDNFKHFLKIDVSIKEISTDDLFVVQQTLLNSETPEICQIQYQNLVLDKLQTFTRIPSTASPQPQNYNQTGPEYHLEQIFGSPTIAHKNGEIERKWIFKNRKNGNFVMLKMCAKNILIERLSSTDAHDFVIVVN